MWIADARTVQTNGRGVDHILEVGGPGTIMKSVNAVRYGGTVSPIGFVAGVSTYTRIMFSA